MGRLQGCAGDGAGHPKFRLRISFNIDAGRFLRSDKTVSVCSSDSSLVPKQVSRRDFFVVLFIQLCSPRNGYRPEMPGSRHTASGLGSYCFHGHEVIAAQYGLDLARALTARDGDSKNSPPLTAGSSSQPLVAACRST
jgi:hypothetical protein